MMAQDKSPEIQQADDMLVCMMEQRNAALNEVVQLRAQLRAASRKIVALETQAQMLSADADHSGDKADAPNGRSAAQDDAQKEF
mgnify:CR=1 FL=1